MTAALSLLAAMVVFLLAAIVAVLRAEARRRESIEDACTAAFVRAIRKGHDSEPRGQKPPPDPQPFRYGPSTPEPAGPLVLTAADVEHLCHWQQDVDGIASQLSHVGFHLGYVCPYFAVAELMRGNADPRDRSQIGVGEA